MNVEHNLIFSCLDILVTLVRSLVWCTPSTKWCHYSTHQTWPSTTGAWSQSASKNIITSSMVLLCCTALTLCHTLLQPCPSCWRIWARLWWSLARRFHCSSHVAMPCKTSLTRSSLLAITAYQKWPYASTTNSSEVIVPQKLVHHTWTPSIRQICHHWSKLAFKSKVRKSSFGRVDKH